jgi:hypothetical protein
MKKPNPGKEIEVEKNQRTALQSENMLEFSVNNSKKGIVGWPFFCILVKFVLANHLSFIFVLTLLIASRTG